MKMSDRKWRRCWRKLRQLAIIAAFASCVLAACASPVSAQPAQGDIFEYEYTQEVDDGSGGYYGWWEKTVSHGRYYVTSVSDGKVEMTALYGWYYDASDSPKTPVHYVAENFSYSAETRHYVYGYDLDVDYGPDPSVWFWVPTGMSVGQQVHILNSTFTVESTDATVWSDWLPKRAIMLVERGSGMRDDVYGQMSYTYTDRYYMDKDTGYIIAERYTEHDTGWWAGHSSSFDWTEKYDITSSSYRIPIDWITLTVTVLIIAGIFLLMGGGIYAVRWRSRTLTTPKKVKVYRIRKMAKYPHLPNKATINFEPFLEDFADKALRSGGRVAVATSHDGLEGLAIYHKDAKVGAIFCKDYDINDPLRRFVGAKDFFSEIRHQVKESYIEELRNTVAVNVGHDAYNTFETSRVLGLSQLPDTGYDSANLRLMALTDMDEVAAIAKKVYKVRARRWMRSLVDTGDIGVVATVNGKVVGFAFATVIDDAARFHTLTVSPEMRGQGLAKELMRARLHFAKSLGVKNIILEIADWNLPSISVSTSFGFRNIGNMYVETTRIRRMKKNIVRRW